MADKDNPEGKPPEKAQTPAPDDKAKKPEPAKEKDWWDGFRETVEDPNASTYEYLRDHVRKSLALDGDEKLSELALKARQKAIAELLELKDPKELSAKLKAIEGNRLIFSGQTGAAIKLFRVIIDAYVEAQGEDSKEKKEAAIEKRLSEEHVREDIDELSKTLDGKDKEEIRRTVESAARQMSDDKTVAQITKDIIATTGKYVKPDTVAMIAVNALPLITWQYKWAFALGLGAFASRHSVYHGYKAAQARWKGDIPTAKEEGAKAVTALKGAGGTVLLVGISPLVGKAPAIATGLLNFAISKTYDATIDTVKEALTEEQKNPGSTPVSKGVKAGVGGFFKKNRDSLTSLTVKFLSSANPTTVTKTVADVSDKMPASRLMSLADKTRQLGVSLTKRFNGHGSKAIAEEKEKLADVKKDVADIGKAFEEKADKPAAKKEQKLLPPPSDGPAPPPAP